MTKQKLISLIIKKQTYKQLKPTITQIGKQHIETIKITTLAIQQILTKQYNAESKLYALRFLKDSFEAGSKQFINYTSQHLLPIITNIIIDSTDQTAITKYAGSSFTRTTDLEKFKSIIVSFFKLAKECVMKWAHWLDSNQYQFMKAYVMLQKKEVKFDGEFKYFRQENQVNFVQNCKRNGLVVNVAAEKRQSIKEDALKENTNTNSNPSKPLTQALTQPLTQPPINLTPRLPPKSKNKHVLKCHNLFKIYDQKLKTTTMLQSQLEQMNNQINSHLEEYMGLADLNQTQMESQLTIIFENIKNFKEDFARVKQIREGKIQGKEKSLTIKKTEHLTQVKKVQTPQSPINQLNIPESLSPRGNNVQKFQQTPSKKDFSSQVKKQKPQSSSIKKVESSKTNDNLKVQKKKIQVFEDDSSIMQSEIKPNPKAAMKQEQKANSKSINSSATSKPITLNQPKNISHPQNLLPKDIKSPKNQQPTSMQGSFTKISDKSMTKQIQKFQNNISISRTQSSRVNFSESSIDDDSSNDQSSKIIVGNFKKQKTDIRLSAIIEQHAQQIENSSSRRNINQSEYIQSSIIQKPNDRIIVENKQSPNPNEIKLPKKAIDQYQSKIKTLENHLREKQSKEKQLQKRLTELNTMKKIQQQQLQKIRQENNKILERFSNPVDPEQYARIKKDFEQMKLRNKKMEGNMDKLTKEIQSLKVVQKEQHSSNAFSLKSGNKQNQMKMMPEPNNLFQNTQNLLKSPSVNNKISTLQKPTFTYHPHNPTYLSNLTHLCNLPQLLTQNNLTLLKKSILKSSQLFYNSQDMSLICRMSSFNKNQLLALKLQLSFKFNNSNQKDVRPNVTIFNLEEIEVWKKPIYGEDFLYHQELVVKLKQFPFSLLKMEVSTDENTKKSLVLPFIYFSFLKKCPFTQQRFDQILTQNKDSAIRSKVFNLVLYSYNFKNTKVIKDLKSLQFYQQFSMTAQNRMCFRLCERQENNSFWCEITNLAKQKCILKVIPQPYNQEMYLKGQQLMQNLIFLLAGN